LPEHIDDTDRGLVGHLRFNGRKSSKALASELGVAETTIRTRLRRLAERSIMTVTAVTDMEAFGHEFLVVAKVRTAGRPAPDVAVDLAHEPETIGVFVTTGRYDLMVSMLARDNTHLATLLGLTIPTIDGVDIVRSELALDVLKYESTYASIGTDDFPTEPWAASSRVDDMDLAIVGHLREDARDSNRSIAARLGVYEGTVRYRIRRMEADNVIRIQTVCDVSAFGFESFAYLGVQVAGPLLDNTAAALKNHPAIPVLLRTIGEFELMCVIQATDRQALVNLAAHVGAFEGVRRIEVFECLRPVKHSYTWAKLC
jgi:DNA-binding Lrp family transcriptional regulator